MPGIGSFNIDSRNHRNSLVNLLMSDYAWIKLHTRLSDRAMAWDAGDRSPDRLLTETEFLEAEEWLAQRPPSAPDPTPVVDDFIQSSRSYVKGNLSALLNREV